MTRRELRGLAASPGSVVAPVHQVARPQAPGMVSGTDREGERARAALEEAARQMDAVAARLRGEGREAEAEIVETSVLMARDPALADGVHSALAAGTLSAAEAILTACDALAEQLAALPDPVLSARADDVRSVGRRAARLASPQATTRAVAGDHVLVADDLGPADVAELSSHVRAIALAGGGPTAHAAIVARSLGLPMVTGLGEDVLEISDAEQIVVDGDAGVVVVGPGPEEVLVVREAAAQRAAACRAAGANGGLAAETTDGHRTAVLANVAGAAELRIALAAGAEGVGLFRTELAFLDADAWPGLAEHRRMLEPVLQGVGGRPATVRVLDFGGDKVPPFLAGTAERGVRVLLAAPDALDTQLGAILQSRGYGPLRVLVPMVDTLAELVAVRDRLVTVAGELGLPLPELGPMIETPAAAANARELASRSDFLSIGTNDLTSATLSVDRFGSAEAVAYHPLVLASIARAVQAARDAGIPVEVCGEAASTPIVLPLLVGLGVDEVSVGASRVGIVRSWVRSLSYAQVTELAQRALEAPGPDEVRTLVAPVAATLVSIERGEVRGDRVERDGGVVAAGGQA